jgi:ABC-type branched-subunit amino acid transport system ATPase component
MLRLPIRTPVEYETNLSRIFQVESRKGRLASSIHFLDTQSILTRYFRTQPEFKPLFEQLESTRVQSSDEILTLLRSVGFHQKLETKSFLVVSPYYHLLEPRSAMLQKRIVWKIEQALENIERKHAIHVIVAEE